MEEESLKQMGSVEGLSLPGGEPTVEKVEEPPARSNVEVIDRWPKPLYPKDAVGIENAREEVIKLLNMIPENDEDESPLTVVIYGFGGVGKTTLATAVVAMLNLDSYNYARVHFNEKMSKNDLRKMQERILKYGFPTFNSEVIMLRDCKEGRDRLTEAFRCVENKPVFLLIDNLLRSKDLKELFPEDLSGLPKHSRIFITTRTLKATDGLLTSGIKCCPFSMKILDRDNAAEILFKDRGHNDSKGTLQICEGVPLALKEMLQICEGVPLALSIVHGHLFHSGTKGHTVSNAVLNALQNGGYIKEKKMSRRLLHSVYNELEDSTKDAFLDICCFFNGWIRRHVEYIVGASEVKLLEEAALVTPFFDEKVKGIYAGEERLIVHSILRARGRSMSASTRFMNLDSFREAAKDKTRLKGIKGLWFEDSSSEYMFDVQHLKSMRNSLRILCLGVDLRTSAESPIKFKELRYLKLKEHARMSKLDPDPARPSKQDLELAQMGALARRAKVDLELKQMRARARHAKEDLEHAQRAKLHLQLAQMDELAQRAKLDLQFTQMNAQLADLRLELAQKDFVAKFAELELGQRQAELVQHELARSSLLDQGYLQLDVFPESSLESQLPTRQNFKQSLQECDEALTSLPKRSPKKFNELLAQNPTQIPMKLKESSYREVREAVPQPQIKLEEFDMLGIFDGPYKPFPTVISMNKLPRRLRMIRASQALASKESSNSTEGIQNHSVEELHLRGLYRKQLPQGLHQLCSLKIIVLDSFEMVEFPEEICQLSSLINLCIVLWRRLKRLPESFGRLKGLTRLKISYCYKLKELPSSFGQLTALEHLNLEHCSGLKQLPGGLENLKYLNLTGCKLFIEEFYLTKQNLKIVRET